MKKETFLKEYLLALSEKKVIGKTNLNKLNPSDKVINVARVIMTNGV